MTGGGVGQGPLENGCWTSKKQGETHTERGSDLLMLQKLREGKCLPAGHPGPDSGPLLQIGVNANVIRVWYPSSFFKQTLKRQVSFLSYVEVLAPPCTFYDSL